MTQLERLQKVMAHRGVASRRRCEQIIKDGKVSVNGEIVTQLGVKVNPEKDDIRVSGRPLEIAQPYRYLFLHKPKGVLSSLSDPHHSNTLRQLIDQPARLYPVGRLDLESEGLMLMTDDGDLALRLTHPRYHIAKRYVVQVAGWPDARDLRRLEHGMRLLDGNMSPAAEVRFLGPRPPRQLEKAGIEPNTVQAGSTVWVSVTVFEGRKRLVRRMFQAIHHPVLQLVRLSIGPFHLGNLRSGKWRYANTEELARIKHILQKSALPTNRSHLNPQRTDPEKHQSNRKGTPKRHDQNRKHRH